MKKLVLVLALVLLAAVSASAAEISQATPATTVGQQTPEAIFLIGPILQPTPRCYALDGTSCPANGATTACTDACHNNLSCTCYSYYGGPYNTTFLGRYWNCNDEC